MPEPAKYAPNDDLERRAVDVFNFLLDTKYIKADVKKADKVPNHDGEVELVDDQSRPIGKFNVQVKKMPDDFTDRYGDCPVGLIEYSTRIEQPFLFIGVDINKKKAYWKQILPAMAQSLAAEQKTFTLVFDTTANVIEEGNSLYISKWTEILLERQRDRAELPRLKQLITETLGLESIPENDRKMFQDYIEQINTLLASDFSFVKNEYLPDISKLGMAIVDNTPDSLVYHYFAIGYGVPTQTLISLKGHAPVKFFDTPPKTYLSDILGQKNVQAFATSFQRKSHFDPIKNATQFVLDFVEKSLTERIFQPFGEALCLEEIFVFLDRYSSVAGLQQADSYSVDDLNHGLREYLPVWFNAAVATIFSGSGIPFITLDVFENLASANQHSSIVEPSLVKQSIGKVSTPISNAILTYKKVRAVLSAIDFLSSKGIGTLSRPYQNDPTGVDMNIATSNIIKVINSCGPIYKEFVQGNQLRGLAGAYYYGDRFSSCFVADTPTWKDGLIRMTEYHVEDPERTLPKTSFFEEREGKIVADFKQKRVFGPACG